MTIKWTPREEAQLARIERKIATVIAHWEQLPSQKIRPAVSSIECDHVDTCCSSCMSRDEHSFHTR